MSRYHINPMGDPGPCRASIKCPFGDESEHYDTKEEAREFYEKQSQSLVAPLKQTSMDTRMQKPPEIKGLIYLEDSFGEGVSDIGVSYTSVDAYRVKKNGDRSRIAALTIYDDDTVIAWDRTEASDADIRMRNKLTDSLKTNLTISPVSSLSFTL